MSSCLTQAADSTPPDSLASLMTMIVGLAVVLGVLFAVVWLMRRAGALRQTATGGLRLVAGLAVGARERVVLVEVGEHWLVLGVAPGAVRHLHTLAKIETAAGATGTRPDFPGLLARLRSGR